MSAQFTNISLSLARSFLGTDTKVKMDRPLGTRHPKHGCIYEVNYGYVPGTKASDGEPLDAYFLGVDEPLAEAMGTCIAVVHRKDDDDDKLIVVPPGMRFSDDEILKLVAFQERWFSSLVLRS